MNSVLFILDKAPYGTENAFGIECGGRLPEDGGYPGPFWGRRVPIPQRPGERTRPSQPIPDPLAYPEIRVVTHEPSLAERGLLGRELLEMVELLDHEEFLKLLEESKGSVFL